MRIDKNIAFWLNNARMAQHLFSFAARRIALLVLCIVAFAGESSYSAPVLDVEIAHFRYQMHHFLRSGWEKQDTLDETLEYFKHDMDVDVRLWKEGTDLAIGIEFDPIDNFIGDDKPLLRTGYDELIDSYWLAWQPASKQQYHLTVKVGDFGTNFGKTINNYHSPRGSFEISWKIREMSFVLGYGRKLEGDTNDDVGGDIHMIRSQAHAVLNKKSGLTLGAYAELFTGRGVVIKEKELITGYHEDGMPIYNPAIEGDVTTIVGAVEAYGNVKGIFLYVEGGAATGTMDQLNSEKTASQTYDLSGYYALGGVKWKFGPVMANIEAAYGSGDDDPSDFRLTALGGGEDFVYDEVIENFILRNSLVNKQYAKISLMQALSKRLLVMAAAIYQRPTETFISPYTKKTTDTYGVEFDTQLNYTLTKSLTYIFKAGFVAADDDWMDSDPFKIVNRLVYEF